MYLLKKNHNFKWMDIQMVINGKKALFQSIIIGSEFYYCACVNNTNKTFSTFTPSTYWENLPLELYIMFAFLFPKSHRRNVTY